MWIENVNGDFLNLDDFHLIEFMHDENKIYASNIDGSYLLFDKKKCNDEQFNSELFKKALVYCFNNNFSEKKLITQEYIKETIEIMLKQVDEVDEALF